MGTCWDGAERGAAHSAYYLAVACSTSPQDGSHYLRARAGGEKGAGAGGWGGDVRSFGPPVPRRLPSVYLPWKVNASKRGRR